MLQCLATTTLRIKAMKSRAVHLAGPAPAEDDPYLRANTSLRDRYARALWRLVYVIAFRPSPRPLHAWRVWLLRLFGAELGANCHIYPGAEVWAPWNLRCEDVVAIADGAIIYNPSPVSIGSHAVVSQQAYLCGASHDYRHPSFPMVVAPIRIGRRAWICARATVQMGVTVGEGTVLALGAVAPRDLAPWTVYAGVPARPVGKRPHAP